MLKAVHACSLSTILSFNMEVYTHTAVGCQDVRSFGVMVCFPSNGNNDRF